VTKEERNTAKSLVYGVLYGRGAPSLADQLEVTVGEAAKYQSTFLQSFPELKEWISRCKQEAMKTKRVLTLFGRQRLLADSFELDSNRALRQGYHVDLVSIHVAPFTCWALLGGEHGDARDGCRFAQKVDAVGGWQDPRAAYVHSPRPPSSRRTRDCCHLDELKDDTNI